ncbi:hypothetical protein [Endozoicomonas euniceicola]|uniref:Uncharacterized protein n=1 Tax=Endozoicomonas euniceicola TaxID=1234143 RepID=A0ABY6GPA1_9GAMM|nr:hypothetical protein [Endozoicomonas euniceicola]UYM14520.1 hypothetical protein NX720_16675 [Endozoicomonas euniceicola]
MSYSSDAVNVPDTSNKKEYEFVWSGVTEGRHLQACLPESWSLATESQGVKVMASTLNEPEGSDCKLLYFHSAQGRSRLKTKTADVQNHLFQPTFPGPDFTGVIALKPVTERNSQVQGYSITSDVKPQNETGHLPLPYDRSDPPLLFGSSSGHMGLDDPFDDRKPPFLFSPLAGSELVISPVLAPQNQHPFIRITILLLSGESFTSTLSGDEALALKKAKALTNPFQLLSYLRRKQHWLSSWFSQREDLESALENSDEANERYIQNLIDSLNDMKVMITSDQSIPVSGILNAMINGNPENTGNSQEASGNGLRHRKTGGASNNRNPAGNGESGNAEGVNGGGGDGQHPDQTVKKTEGESGSRLDIRSILNQSQFSELFNTVPDFVLSSLYAYGQLTAEQLAELLMAFSEDDLSSSLRSDDLIEKLEQRNDEDKAISLSVLHHIAKTVGENNNLHLIHQLILAKTPSAWRDVVRKKPEIPNDNIPEEVTRHLAKLLGFNGEKRVNLYNNMARKGYIPSEIYSSRLFRPYPVALFIIHNHKLDKSVSGAVLEYIHGLAPDLDVERRLTELLYGTQEQEMTEHTTGLPMQTEATRQNQDLKEKSKAVTDFLKQKGIKEYTLNLLNNSGLLDENRINKICIDNSGTINKNEIDQLLNDLVTHTLSIEALKQLGYSESAIEALKNNGNLHIDNCKLLAQAFDDNAAEVIAEGLTGKLKIFNSFLRLNNIKHPELVDRLRTNDEWSKLDSGQTAFTQHREIIRHYGLETYVNMQAQYIVDSEAASPLDEFDISVRVNKAIKALATSHDHQYERLTGENLHLSITTAIKYMIKFRVNEIVRQKTERQKKIDEGRESWCEWLTRMIFG